jgi:Flp pilus assembly protein TadG
MTGLLIVPLALAAGLAVDTSRFFLVRAHLGDAVDAAALAAGQAVDPATVATDAERIFRLNYPAPYLGAAVGDLDVDYDETSGRVEIVADTAVPTAFMRLADVESVAVRARAVVLREQAGLELVLVLDVSGSMCQPYGSPCTGRPKITALKQAANDLLDVIYGPNDSGEDLYVGVVPFNSRVKVGTGHASWLTTAAPAQWKGCMEQRSGALAFNDGPPGDGKWPATPKSVTYQVTSQSHGRTVTEDVTYTIPCNSALLPLTASKAVVKASIDGLTADGGTRIDIAAGWGWRVISQRWQGLWGTAGLPLDDVEKTAKAIVIMSDGFNEPYAPIDGSMTTAQADQNVNSTCRAMRDAGYEVFTVPFQAPAAGQQLLRDCAGSSDHYFESATAADLRRSFRQIAGRLSALRLAE